MKKNIFLLFAACLLGVGPTMAVNVLTVSNVSVPQGGQATIEIGCEFDTEFTAFELQLALPEGLTLLSDEDGKPILERAFDGSHTMTGSLLPSNGNYKFTCYSTDENSLSMPTSGPLLRVTVLANATLALGSVLTATVTACEFTRTANSMGENLADVDFTVSISELRTILDENATTAPLAEENTNVRVKRTINAGEWSTLVLPFDMTAAQVYEAFGDDVELQEFIDYEANDDLTQITINFEPALIAEDGLMANYPYVIRTSRDITEFTVDGVTIDPDEEGAVAEYTNGRTGSRKVVYAYFQGTYKAGTVIPADNLFLSDNQFWYSVGMTQTKAYRAYFWLQDMLASASDGASSRIILNVGNGGVATGITSHESQAVGGSEVYDLQGRRVDIPSRKGLYIRDGKKVVINN